MKYTPGPWIWGNGWKVADKIGTVYYDDGENPQIEKYMDMGLKGADGEIIIPLRIDHYKMIYDGKPITPIHRNLIASAPELLEACKLMLAAWEQLLPNLKNGVVQDYELVCTKAPRACRQAIAKAEGK